MTTTYDWMLLAPVAIPAIGAVLLLVLDVLFPRIGRGHWVLAALLLLAGAGCAVPPALPDAPSLQTSLCLGDTCVYAVDHVGAGLQLAALATAAVVALLAYPIPAPTERPPVLAALVLAAAAGAAGVAAAGDLGSWLVMIELATLPTVVLVALRARRAAVDGAALHLDALFTQAYVFGDRLLDNVGTHPDPAETDVALADAQRFLHDRDDLVLAAAGTRPDVRRIGDGRAPGVGRFRAS